MISMSYSGPVKSMHYLLRHAVDIDALLGKPAHSEVSHDLISDVLAGAASFAEDVLAPINWDGDQNPAQLKDDNVTASPGFKDAYKAFVDSGWQSLPIPAEQGGMGLPSVISVATNEMIYAANMAFGLCPMLTSSAVKAIAAHASDDLKAAYLPKMVTGEWTGAMCLTEPQAGSDLGPIRTKAVDNGDGSYAITGQKIYITWGDHDCADNIIHLVLARLPDAPDGSRGISLFLCPKFLMDDDGAIGARNRFKPIGLEHKLGIHGSPTCVMEFDGAVGWLVGEVNRGLACMFTMMNEARLFVGVQGVAIGDRAFQAALGYANDRVQGRVADGAAKDPIIGHPDVRRMLIDMKARLMSARAINMATAMAGDLALCTDDKDAAAALHAREALLTPVAKAYCTDMGVDTASIGVQIHGGMGFVEETGAAQHYRDARIAPIYEGTNGIQAIDLIGRKIRRDGGEAMRGLLSDLQAIDGICAAAEDQGADFAIARRALSIGLETLSAATDIILNSDEMDALSAATPFLKLVGDVVSGAYIIKAAANGMIAGDNGAAEMKSLADYHALAILPQASGQLDFIRAAAKAVFDFPVLQLADL
jgi:alkylation response protein AidB-like acyl-CoA dehydrogenase